MREQTVSENYETFIQMMNNFNDKNNELTIEIGFEGFYVTEGECSNDAEEYIPFTKTAVPYVENSEEEQETVVDKTSLGLIPR